MSDFFTVGNGIYPEDEIIAVLDADNASAGKDTKRYLKAREEKGGLISELGEEASALPRYIVITHGFGGEKAHLTRQKPKAVN